MLATTLSDKLWLPFLIVSCFFGIMLIYSLLPNYNRLFFAIAPKRESLTIIPRILFYFPAGIMIGLLSSTFLTYFLALLLTPFSPTDVSVLFSASLISICVMLLSGIIMLQKKLVFFSSLYAALEKKMITLESPKKIEKRQKKLRQMLEKKEKLQDANSLIPTYKNTTSSLVFFLVSLLIFLSAGIFIFYYSFFSKDTTIYAGQTVFSDLASHTALVSSFANGKNFPTEFPHFPGDGISYHFMFFFLSGLLHSLGLPLVHALNIPSLLSLLCCFCLLGTLSVLLCGKRLSFFFSGFFVLFRHSLSFISLFMGLLSKNNGNVFDSIRDLFQQSSWFGTTPYDNWGLWTVNVYANQRHLLFGVSLLLIVLFLLIPFTRRMTISLQKKEGVKEKLRSFFLDKDAWLPSKNDLLHPWSLLLLSVIIVVFMPYFHGSALISLLLILFALFIFSKARILFVITAAAGILSAFLQSMFFSGGAQKVFNLTFEPGFVAEYADVMGILSYLFRCFGMLLPMLLLMMILIKGHYKRILVLAIYVPSLFAFLFQVTREMNANHKFIQISLILFCGFLAAGVSFLFSPFQLEKESAQKDFDPEKEMGVSFSLKRNALIGSRILAGFLVVFLSLNGFVEWGVFTKMNTTTVQMQTNSPVTTWIQKNTSAKSVFLTAPYSMHSFFLSGRFSYYGHPYYAWSAGSDTDGRRILYAKLLTGCNGDYEEFLRLCYEENIRFVLVDDILRTGEFSVDEAFFSQHLPLVAVFPEDRNTLIFQIPYQRSLATDSITID